MYVCVCVRVSACVCLNDYTRALCEIPPADTRFVIPGLAGGGVMVVVMGRGVQRDRDGAVGEGGGGRGSMNLRLYSG